MKEFKIYYENLGNEETYNFKQFAKKISDIINSNEELLDRSKKANQDFTNKLKEITSDQENDFFTGSMIIGLLDKFPRFSYIKNLEFNGAAYEAEIDELKRVFHLIKVD